jgi:hypothetical protein
MEPVERKYSFTARCLEHAGVHLHTEADAVVFLAKDRALPDTLRCYATIARSLGAEPRQLEGIRLLIARVERWQAEHPEMLKVADVEPGAAGDPIVKPNEGPIEGEPR